MGVNSLSDEMLLARFFDASLLGTYCRERLGKSDKGGAATLAARIARAWSHEDFAATVTATAGTSGSGKVAASNEGGARAGKAPQDAPQQEICVHRERRMKE